MREILFKAKRLDNGEWVEGFIVARQANTYPDGFEIIETDGINYDELDFWQPAFQSYGVYPKTICQYTGLTDKNGKCVFEGDIVKHYNKIGIGEPDKYIIAAIRWEECKARFIQDTEDGIYAVYDSSVFEVIGNIFDNPELMERMG